MIPADQALSPDIVGMSNSIFLGFLWVSVALLVGITITTLWFTYRYHRKRNPAATQIPGNLTLEIVWTVVPAIVVLGMFYYGLIGFKGLRSVPKDAMEVSVTARMWSWLFTYENGIKSDELRVPVGRPVKLNITSADVIHSLYIPAFRIKEDAVPGMKTYLWFMPEREGKYDIYCSEYCGTGHSSMLSKVVAMPTVEFTKWYEASAPSKSAASDAAATPSAMDLLTTLGCTGCHSLDGSVLVGPTLKGIWGRQETVVTGQDVHTITVDEAYLRRSLLKPGADILKGFPPVMPPQTQLKEEEIDAIIEYLKELK